MSGRTAGRSACPGLKSGKKAFIPEVSCLERERFCVPLSSCQGRKERQGRRFLPHRFCQLPQACCLPQNRPPAAPQRPFPGLGGWFLHRAAPGADRGLTGAQPGFSRPQGVLRHRRHPRHREGCRTPPPTGGRCCDGSQSALPGPPSRTATASSAVSAPWR